MSDLPRVTTVIQAAGLLPPYPENGGYLEKGTATDFGCQLLFKGHRLEDLEVDERIIGYLQSLNKWIQHTGFCAKRIQHEWESHLGFIGHPDVDDGKTVIDTKTGSPAKHYRIQTAAYLELGQENGVNLRQRACLYLKEDGSMAKIEPHEDRSDWQCFLSALKLYQGERNLQPYRDNIKRWLET